MHVFLTGDLQVGKSTLIEKVLDRLRPSKLGGFRTVLLPDRGEGKSVYLLPARGGQPSPENRVGACSACAAVGFPAAFDRAGCEALAGAEDCSLIRMDEVSRMEREAERFSTRILELLEGSTPILGVVRQEAETPLCSAIRSHKNVRLVRVTRENRDEMVDIIIELLQKPCS